MKMFITKMARLSVSVTNTAYQGNLRLKNVLTRNNAEGFVDTAIKILMAVVIGALVLGGLYALFNDTVIPTLVERVEEMFDYKG